MRGRLPVRGDAVPEEIVRRLLCDRPHATPTPGKRWLIDDGRRAMSVILCDDHDTLLRELAALGVPAPKVPARRQPSPRGLSDDRLDGLIRPRTENATENTTNT